MNSPFFPATFKLDFCLAGSIVHAWLPQAFQAAYADMAFKEFSEADATADPRLVESLSFHAVNGRRLKSSKDFWPTWIPNGLSGYWHWPWNLPEC